MTSYGILRGFALGNLIGGSIGAGVLWATRHIWLAAVLLFAGIAGATCLAIAEQWETEQDNDKI